MPDSKQDSQATPAAMEETINLPSVVASTRVAVGNVLLALIALAITYFTEPLFRNGYWFKVATITYFFASLGLLATHLLGAGSRRLHSSRTIRAENDCIRVMQPRGCSYFRLRDCYWQEAIRFCDAIWFRWRGKPCLVLREKNTYNNINCGVTPETKSAWIAFLQQEAVPEGRPLTYAQRLWTIAGIVAGFCLAYILAPLASDLNLGKQKILAIQLYCWGTLPLLGGFFGSVLSGNDWFGFSKKKSSGLMFQLFAAIGCISLLPAIHWKFQGQWHSLLKLGFGSSVNGLVGIGLGFILAYLGEKRRQAYLSQKNRERQTAT